MTARPQKPTRRGSALVTDGEHTAAGAQPPAPRKSRSRLLGALALMGPGFIVGAWQFGPGNLASAVQAGSLHGYDLIWVIAVSTVLMLGFTDMSVRIALASDRSLIQMIKKRLGKVTGVAAGIGVFLITLMFSVGNAVGSGLGMSMVFGGSPTLWTLACTVLVAIVAWAPNYYKVFERGLLAIIALMAIGFLASAVLTKPDWVEVADGFIPSLPPGAGMLLVALVGTNFSINAAFYTGYASRERGLRPEQYKATTLADTIPGIVAPGIMTILVIVAAATALRATGGEAKTLADLAKVLEPVAGPAGPIVFGLGFTCAAFSSMIANATAGGTLISDALGWGNKLDRHRVKAMICLVLAFGLAVTLLAQGSPIQLIITAQALTVIVAPLLGILLLIMATRKDVMGKYVNRWWQTLLGLVGLIAILATCYRLASSLLGG
ncbi:Nramp family divalent metal transporter [uncultured Citricoccus sp.]|uniref:Nramp family divalent metal transporter n=1 Tax=uncultured Citricoccus sp. TaxID=614031 RepID=UPI002616BA9B|nr:Nramp family divalent metal transporter [uncultured Citricoccus sp.]HRO95014.1 Nramp family divalent metal transporter [Citricoccus sp.]